jgi:acyl carrier protein
VLRVALVGGEALPPELADRIRGVAASAWNLYGPTEATVWATAMPLDGAAGDTPPAIGWPVPNVRVWVLDGDGNVVPVGVPGELWVAGACVARGYLGRPGLTAERFVADRFGGGPGERMYGTGDVVRWRADGALEFLGRVDHQVKLRGFRVELGEIEATLMRHPTVREAAVLAREDRPGDQRLVAYLVPHDGQRPVVEQVRAFLKERLPDYMLPAAFVSLEALPLTPNGKVDRRALPAPEAGRPELAAGYVAPRTPTEALVADVWARVLGIEDVGVNDNFFDLGGTSLLAMRVHSRLQEALEREVRIVDLFQFPTVSAFSKHLDGAREEPLVASSAARAARQRAAFGRARLGRKDK